MSKLSNQSNPVRSINFSYGLIENFSCNFVYNFYTSDESTNATPRIPDVYKKPTINKNDVNLVTFSLRVPRYVELNWKKVTSQNTKDASINKVINNINPNLQKNYSKIITETNVINSKYMPHKFTSRNVLENASEDINKDVNGISLSQSGISQATIIENFISDLIKGYEETAEKSNSKKIRNAIQTSIASIEKFADRPDTTIGINFFNNDNKKQDTEFDKLVKLDSKVYSQINRTLVNDIFNFSSLPIDQLNAINTFYQNSNSSTQQDLAVEPIEIGEELDLDKLDNSFADSINSIQTVGYIIEKYRLENEVYLQDSIFYIDNPDTTSILDVNVKYGSSYFYSIKAIAQLKVPTTFSDGILRLCTYYFAGQSFTTNIICEENTPPPPITEMNFVWNYKESKLSVTWELPFNSQRDITQFQVLRRKTIYEPFELLEQQCFDYSDKKTITGEIIDGNNPDVVKENLKYIVYSKIPTTIYRDDEFKVDYENLVSSKYIYTIVAIDAHGLISNYGTQVEVTFDFFKNELIKKVVSSSGASRAYPNLYLNADLFKDIIQVSGASSQKLKIYFMPEYFKVHYGVGKIEKLLATKQDGGQGGYYKLQFINVQNQKLDQLRIDINDPNLLAAVTSDDLWKLFLASKELFLASVGK
jgi:hypothetical protein